MTNEEQGSGATNSRPLPAELAESLPALGFGAADAAEAEALAAALAEYPEAAAELAEYAALHRALLYAAPPAQPPARLARRLEQAIAPAPAPDFWARLRRGTVGERREPSAGPLRWAVGVAMAALLLLNGYLLGENRTLRQEQAAMAAQLERQNLALGLLAADDVVRIDVPAAEDGSSAHASVLWSPDYKVAILYAEGFPVLSADQVYQLWLVQGEERSSGGLFTVSGTGSGTLVFLPEPGLDAFDRLGITPEPAGGSPGPTSPAVVRGPIEL